MEPTVQRGRQAIVRLAQRRRRVRTLRWRAVAVSLTLFALTWLVVFAQMVTGHDPVLGSDRSSPSGAATTREPGHPAATTQLTIDPVTGQLTTAPSVSTPTEAPSQPEPLVTRQS